MKVEVLESAKSALGKNFSGKNVVVIDVLRATSVIITAFINGASEIYPFMGIEECLNESKKIKNVLLAGERKGLKIDGFDFGNSPLELTKEKVNGKAICMTTSNGTRAIKNAITADNIFIGAYLNASAVANKVLKEKKDLVILCSGTNDNFSLDDALCAGIILQKLEENIDLMLDDFGISLLNLAKFMPDIKTILDGTKHYSYLKSIGYQEDLKYCTSLDITKIVPFYLKNKILID